MSSGCCVDAKRLQSTAGDHLERAKIIIVIKLFMRLSDLKSRIVEYREIHLPGIPVGCTADEWCGDGDGKETSVWFGNIKILSFLLAQNIFLFASSVREFQYALGWFAAKCDSAGS